MKKTEVIKGKEIQVVCPNCGNSSEYAKWKNSDSTLRVLTYTLKNNKHFEFDMHTISCPICNESITVDELHIAVKEYVCPHCSAVNTIEKWNEATEADFGEGITEIENAFIGEELEDFDYTCPKCKRNSYLSRLIEYNLLNGDDTHQELELTDEMIERNDEIDNAVYECICILAEKELDWNMGIIGNVTDAIKAELAKHGIKVRHPGVVTDKDGSQHYDDEYDE